MRYPPFVKLMWRGVANTSMRLQSERNGLAHYYRDAGAWGIDAQWENGVLKAVPDCLQTEHLKEARFIATTEAEWRDDNGIYGEGVEI